MLKKAQLSIFVVIALLIVIAVVIKFFISQNEVEIKFECSSSSDCVPSDCCHATSCVSVSEAPACEGVSCTLNCAPGTLDCGQASCGCSDGLCVVIQNEAN